MRSLYSIFAALFLLPVLAALGATGSVCHDAHRSLVFDETGDLVVAANDVAVSRFAYDDGHCVVSAETLVGEEVFTTLWRRDAAGLVTNVVYDADRVVTRAYDADGRLSSVRDWLGHEWTITHGAGAPVVETYLHDGNGALTNVTAGGETVLSASYDAQGRLAALGPDGWTCAYDGLGNRVRAGGHVWIPDFDDPLKRPLLECAADGTVIRRYIWGPGRLLGFVDAANGLTVAHSDERGSVVALTDVSGNVLHTANYGPHGEDWGATGTNPTPFAWLGGYGVTRLPPSAATAGSALCTLGSSFPIHHSSLYLTRHRLYSATLRRFLSSDPLGVGGGPNLYAYAEGDPLAYIDPLGLCADSGWTRVEGFFQMLGGGAESAAGMAFALGTAETGVGIAAGWGVAVHGADVASAGAYKLWYGVGQDTLTSQGLQAVGVPRDWANGVDAGVSVMGSAGIGMATKAVGGVAASSTEMIEVSRWGRAGLQDGDFVMKGDPSLSNYLLSGKFQPSWMPGNNIPATFKSGESFYVPKSSLSYPSGWEIIKAPLGQRIYSGPTIPPQP